MSWWNTKSGDLQQKVRVAEMEMKSVDYYDEDFVKKMIVHAREDIVLIYSQLSSLNSQLWTIKILLFVIALVMIFNLF